MEWEEGRQAPEKEKEKKDNLLRGSQGALPPKKQHHRQKYNPHPHQKGKPNHVQKGKPDQSVKGRLDQSQEGRLDRPRGWTLQKSIKIKKKKERKISVIEENIGCAN